MIDVHCHLQDPRLLNDVASILNTCTAERIDRLIVNGTRPDDWPVVAELAERYPDQVGWERSVWTNGSVTMIFPCRNRCLLGKWRSRWIVGFR